jgi:hypothetical protein
LARWFTLALGGWLIYGSVRALWAIVRLDVPVYDWQWYVGVVVLAIALVTHIVWHLRRTWLRTLVFTGLPVWLIVGYSGFGQVIELYPARAAPVPISFWAPPNLGRDSEAMLKAIRSAGGKLYLTTSIHSFEGEARQDLASNLLRFSEYDIRVCLAAHVSNYLSVPVYDEWVSHVQNTAAFTRDANATNVWGIIGDAEPPARMPFDFLGLHRNEFDRAVHNGAHLIEMMEEEYPELELGVTANWPHYIDSFDKDADLSVVQRSPVDPPGGWDFISVMAYSSYYPPPWRAYYTYLIERIMARLYPDYQPSYLIGVVGYQNEPLLDYDELVRDARISRAMGVREIVVFYLGGALQDFGDDFVQRFTAAVNGTGADLTVKVPFSRPASMVVYGIAAADALLDIFSWKGVFFVAWLVLSGITVYRRAEREKAR